MKNNHQRQTRLATIYHGPGTAGCQFTTQKNMNKIDQKRKAKDFKTSTGRHICPALLKRHSLVTQSEKSLSSKVDARKTIPPLFS